MQIKTFAPCRRTIFITKRVDTAGCQDSWVFYNLPFPYITFFSTPMEYLKESMFSAVLTKEYPTKQTPVYFLPLANIFYHSFDDQRTVAAYKQKVVDLVDVVPKICLGAHFEKNVKIDVLIDHFWSSLFEPSGSPGWDMVRYMFDKTSLFNKTSRLIQIKKIDEKLMEKWVETPLSSITDIPLVSAKMGKRESLVKTDPVSYKRFIELLEIAAYEIDEAERDQDEYLNSDDWP